MERRFASDAEARRLEAIIEGILTETIEPNIPLYKRIGNQRRALRELNSIEHVWMKVLTFEERSMFIDRWRKQRQKKTD